eukprot:56603-Eustigmatos_ZCMA.PRE.1
MSQDRDDTYSPRARLPGWREEVPCRPWPRDVGSPSERREGVAYLGAQGCSCAPQWSELYPAPPSCG